VNFFSSSLVTDLKRAKFCAKFKKLFLIVLTILKTPAKFPVKSGKH